MSTRRVICGPVSKSWPIFGVSMRLLGVPPTGIVDSGGEEACDCWIERLPGHPSAKRLVKIIGQAWPESSIILSTGTHHRSKYIEGSSDFVMPCDSEMCHSLS